MELTFYGLKEKRFNTMLDPKVPDGIAVSPLRVEATRLLTLACHVRDLFLR